MTIKRKKKGKGTFIAGCVCGIAILGLVGSLNFGGFGFGDGWGFGLGSDGGGGSDDEATDIRGGGAGDSVEDAEGDANDGDVALVQFVTVDGSLILHNGEEISLDQLSLRLINYSDAAWELRSERAIAAVYDDVRALFLDHNVSFTETMD